MSTTSYPVNTEDNFSEYQLNTAKAINNGIAERNLKKLGKVIHSIPKADYWKVTYAYYNLYGVSYNSRIQSLAYDYNDLVKHGLI